MIVVCCRCNLAEAELDDELFEHDGEGDMELLEPVPDGWLPDPESDYGSIHPGCTNTIELRQAVEERKLINLHLFGYFDPPGQGWFDPPDEA